MQAVLGDRKGLTAYWSPMVQIPWKFNDCNTHTHLIIIIILELCSMQATGCRS